MLFQECLQLLHADEESVEWLTYVDYVDEMIVDGFFNTIHCSLKFLLDNTVPRAESEPLFEAVLELQVSLMQLIGRWEEHCLKNVTEVVSIDLKLNHFKWKSATAS